MKHIKGNRRELIIIMQNVIETRPLGTLWTLGEIHEELKQRLPRIYIYNKKQIKYIVKLQRIYDPFYNAKRPRIITFFRAMKR